MLNAVMAGLRKVSFQTFLFNVLVLVIIDGYLNVIIYSYMKKAEILLAEAESDSEIDDEKKNN